MIKILIVDDSAVARQALRHILETSGDFRVVGEARNGREAQAAVARLAPDIVSMDINMPGVDGFEATRRIMENNPTPVVIVSSAENIKEVAMTSRAMIVGALDAVRRPKSQIDPGYKEDVEKLLDTLRVMAGVKTARRPQKTESLKATPAARLQARIDFVVIGASTGGPVALQTIFAGLPSDFPVPIAVVQHMTPGFISGLATWLSNSSELHVSVARDGTRVLPGHVYLAPDDFQMEITPVGRLVLIDAPPVNGLRPAVAPLFRSAAETYGNRAAGVLLSGMGEDGAAELKLLKDAGSLTIAQDKYSSIVHSMPGQAICLGAADHVLPPAAIASLLTKTIQMNDMISRLPRREQAS